MSIRTEPLIINYIAGEDLSDKKHYFVKEGSGENEVVLAAADEQSIGILKNSPLEGAPAEVTIGGGAYLKVAETLAPDSLIKSDANGKGIIVTTNNDFYCARVIEASLADGDIIETLVEKGFYAPTGGTIPLGEKSFYKVLIIGTKVYIGGANSSIGKLYQCSTADPNLAFWINQTSPTAIIRTPPKNNNANDTVYFGVQINIFYAVNTNGTLKWTLAVNQGMIRDNIEVDTDGTIYIISTTNKAITSITDNGASGAKNWDFIAGGNILGGVGIASTVVTAGDTNGDLNFVVKGSGLAAGYSPVNIPGQSFSGQPLILSDTTTAIYFTNNFTGNLYAYNTTNGNPIWGPIAFGGWVLNNIVRDASDNIYLTGWTGAGVKTASYDLSGTPRWADATVVGIAGSAPYLHTDNRLYILAQNGSNVDVFSYHKDTGARTSHGSVVGATIALTTAPVCSGSILYFPDSAIAKVWEVAI